MQKCEFCFIMAPAGPSVTDQKKLPRSQLLDRISALLPHPEKIKKKKKSQEKDRQTEEERHLTHISLQDNHTKTIQLSHRPWGPKVIYRVVAPEMQIIPGLHSLLFDLTSPSKKNTRSLPVFQIPGFLLKTQARDPGREGPGPDSPVWDYSEKVVFEWKARLSKLTLANLPLHIQPLLALAGRVKRSGSATQTPTGLCCTTLLFSFRWEPEKLSSTPGNDEATRRPTLTTWADWQRL